VKPLAKEAPVSKLPHCLWTMVEIMDCCVWELIMIPNKRITRAGIGLTENSYCRGGSSAARSSSL
jgi:hypothetical protein